MEKIKVLIITGSDSDLAKMEESALMLMLYAGYPAALEGLRMVNQCKLGWQDFFVPGAWGPRAVEHKGGALRG